MNMTDTQLQEIYKLARAAHAITDFEVRARALLSAGKPAAPMRTYVTRSGEALGGIALRQCGNENKWEDILALNPNFSDWLPPDYFPVGTVLTLPAAPDHMPDAGEMVVAPARSDKLLTVWYGSMPESNGKTNWTAILHKGDIASGMTIDRSEYPDRVRYEADRMRWLIGEIDKEPWILDYDADKHSGYVSRAAPAQSSEPIYQTRWEQPLNVWGDVPKDVFDNFTDHRYFARRIVYAAPQPSQPAEGGEAWVDPLSLKGQRELYERSPVESAVVLYKPAEGGEPPHPEITPLEIGAPGNDPYSNLAAAAQAALRLIEQCIEGDDDTTDEGDMLRSALQCAAGGNKPTLAAPSSVVLDDERAAPTNLHWLDQSTADPIEKARRVLGHLIEPDEVYFFNDGFPRANVISEQASNVLKVLNSLARAASPQAKATHPASKQAQTPCSCRCEQFPACGCGRQATGDT